MSIKDLKKEDLKKVLKHYNKSIKENIIKMSGSKTVLMEKVMKEFKHNISPDKKTILFIHKKKKSIPTYTLNLKGTTKRKEEDTEDIRVREARRKKTLENKKKREEKEAKKVAKVKQDERIKVLKALSVLRKIKAKTKDKNKIKVVNKKLTALERQKRLLQGGNKKPDIKPIITIQPKIDTTQKLDIKMPKALITEGTALKKILIEDGIIDNKTTINQLIGLEVNNDVSIYFSCYGFNFLYLLLYILKKNKNDCVIFSPDIEIDGSKVKIKGKPYGARDAFEMFNISYGRKLEYPIGMDKTEFFTSLTNCLDNNKSVVIPLGLRGHQNAITVNKNTMEIARFEPHGGESRFKISSSRIDKMIKNLFKNYKYKGKKFEVLGAEDSCPAVSGKFLGKEFRGLQSFSGSSQGVKKTGDPNGFCCIWSLFIMDLSLQYPNEKMADIRKKAQQLLGAWKKPRSEKTPEVRKWIRGYTKYIQDSAKDIFKDGVDFVFPEYMPTDMIEKIKKKLGMDKGNKTKGNAYMMSNLMKMMKQGTLQKRKSDPVGQALTNTLYVSYFIHNIKEMMKFKGQLNTVAEAKKKKDRDTLIADLLK